MHGYGYPPEQPPKRRPSQATLNALRVLFVTLTVLSCGLLAWGSMLRLAIVTRARRDWAALVVVFALNVGLFAFILATPDDPDKMTDTQALIGAGWLFGVVIGAVAYYLYADIRHFGPFGPYAAGMPAAPAQYGGYLPAQAVTPGYGYPSAAPQPPVNRAPVPQAAMPRTPMPRTPMPRTPAPTPPPPVTAPAATPPPVTAPSPAQPVPPPVPQPHAHPRLDQVRAELDELSDYLRKEGGNR